MGQDGGNRALLPDAACRSLGSARRRHKMLVLRPSHDQIGKFRVDCRALRPVNLAGAMSSAGHRQFGCAGPRPATACWFQRANVNQQRQPGPLFEKPSYGVEAFSCVGLSSLGSHWDRGASSLKEQRHPHRSADCPLAGPDRQAGLTDSLARPTAPKDHP